MNISCYCQVPQAFFLRCKETGEAIKLDVSGLCTVKLPIAARTYDLHITGKDGVKYPAIEGLLITPDRAVKIETHVNKDQVLLNRVNELSDHLDDTNEQLDNVKQRLKRLQNWHEILTVVAVVLAAVLWAAFIAFPCSKYPSPPSPRYTDKTLTTFQDQAVTKLRASQLHDLLKLVHSDLNLSITPAHSIGVPALQPGLFHFTSNVMNLASAPHPFNGFDASIIVAGGNDKPSYNFAVTADNQTHIDVNLAGFSKAGDLLEAAAVLHRVKTALGLIDVKVEGQSPDYIKTTLAPLTKPEFASAFTKLTACVSRGIRLKVVQPELLRPTFRFNNYCLFGLHLESDFKRDDLLTALENADDRCSCYN